MHNITEMQPDIRTHLQVYNLGFTGVVAVQRE